MPQCSGNVPQWNKRSCHLLSRNIQSRLNSLVPARTQMFFTCLFNVYKHLQTLKHSIKVFNECFVDVCQHLRLGGLRSQTVRCSLSVPVMILVYEINIIRIRLDPLSNYDHFMINVCNSAATNYVKSFIRKLKRKRKKPETFTGIQHSTL